MIITLLRRFNLDKYLSSWLILMIDTSASGMATLISFLLISGLFPSPLFSVRYGIMLTLVAGAASLMAFYLFRTFRAVIRHTTLREIWKLGAAVVAKIVILGIYVFYSPFMHPSIGSITMGLLLDGLLTLFMLIALRLVMIVVYDAIKLKISAHGGCKRILVYGTDDKQIALSIRLQNSPHYKVVGFLTHGTRMKRYRITEKPVYYFENKQSISYLIEKVGVDAVLFASYDSAQEEKERLIRYCIETGVQVLIVPPIDEVIDGKLMKQSVREIKIEDLLGRPEIQISLDEIRRDMAGKTILVTGAAGSIGSELCRQLGGFGIGRLVMFDNAETPTHNLRLELEERFPRLKFTPVIGDVRSHSRLDFVFRTYTPQIVFHAAAYKHVPLMEENPCEAVLVNVCGSRNVADYCIKYGIEKMVMISTDKAVNPTNVMGASKRLAEIYVQALGQAIAEGVMAGGGTRFVTTRFGNVLGSNGSVIPRFRAQIERGGPVTVTHPDITRFFMTIPEACQLVMEAATMTGSNEIVVFDMGESVRIADLAERMIELAGFQAGKEIEIEYTGLRPGEKLFEEVLSTSENTKPTSHEKIRIAQIRNYNYREAREAIDEMEIAAQQIDISRTVQLMKQTVPEFKSENSRFEEFDKIN